MAVARYRDDIDLTLPMTRTGAEAEAGDKTAKYKYNFHNPNAPMQEMQEVNSENIVSIPADVAANLCYAFQDVAFAHLEDRLERALDLLDNTSIATSTATVNARACTALVVVGGVAANLQLRQRLMDLLSIRSTRAHTRAKTAAAAGTGKQSNNVQPPMPLIFPPIHLCTDNGVMVAWTGIEKLLHGISDDPYDQEVVARWPLGSQVHY